MKIKSLFLLCVIFSFTLIIPKSLNLRDSSSVFKISSCSNLILDKTMNSITGKIIKDSGAQISGEDMEFEDGSFQDSGSKININGKLNFGQTQKILLDGGKTFLGKRGEVFQDISISGIDNLIEGVLFIKSDIELQDKESNVFFDIRNRLDADIKLNSGFLVLYEDLYFLDNKRIFGPGRVALNGHKLSFGSKDLTWNEPILFENASDIDINSNMYIEDTWSFSGDSVLIGNSNIFCVSSDDGIVVRPNTNLLIRDTVLYGISGTKIRCMTDDSTITLQNVKWIQDADFTFSRGSLIFLDSVEFVGNGKKFIYQSQMTSTIKQNAVIHLSSGFTFSYDPIVDRKDLLELIDETSIIYLDGANLFVNYRELNLKKGRLIVDKNSILSSETRDWVHASITDTYEIEGITYTSYDYTYGTSGGITFGNNLLSDDFSCEILNGSELKLDSGILIYRNVNSNSFNAINNFSSLNISSGATLQLDQTLDVGRGKVCLSKNSVLQKAPGKYLIGPIFVYS